MKRNSLCRLYTPIAGALIALPLGCSADVTSDVATDGVEPSVQTVQQALEADPDCEASIYEAEDMFHSTGGPVTDGWNIWSNGYISTTHDFEGGTTTMTAVVRGQFGGGAAPNMVITVGGQQVHATAVGSSSWTEYNFTFEAAGGEQEIQIQFTNDYYWGGQDRNLYVDKLIVGCGVGLCMNGTVNPGEECDDGSQTSNDSCKTDCTWNVCGDGVLYNLITDPNSPNTAEECDDGNDIDDDGCTNDCTLPACGDAIVQAGEECDDGNDVDDDGCANDCTSNSVCGDGEVGAGEECDDGNDVDDDECTNACTVPACGDAIVQAGEECDDGNDVDDDACANDCTANAVCGNGTIEDGEECDDGNADETDSCTSLCEHNECGDGNVYTTITNDLNPNALEECDDGNDVDTDACANDCTVNATYCGDGSVDTGEECDDGNDVDDDACSNSCTLNPFCGDGNVDTGEECDDGNDVNDDDCTNACTVPVCGDAIVQAGEECDDGNSVDDDSCTNACTLPVCGDGIVQSGEECDDGNSDDGDGCDAACVSESTVSASLDVWHTWPTGYCATVDITNDSTDAVTDWSVVFDTNGGSIYTAWSGNFSGNTGEVTVTPVGWNDAIAPGATNSSAGFCVNIEEGGAQASVVSVEATY